MADVNKSVAINYSASTEQLERALKKIPGITDTQAAKAAGELDKNFKKMESSAEKTSKSVSQKMKNVGKSMAIVGAAAAGAVAGVVALSQEFADLTNELVDASTKTGIAVDTLAGLRLAAEGSGLAFANLEGGLIKFQGSMDAAAGGSKNLQDTFDQLGVSVTDSNGELRDADSVFNETIKSLGSLENETQRNAMAMELFGRQSGPALIQSGALDNLESMTDLAVEFGVAIDENGIQAMGQFQRSMAEFETVGMGALQNVMNSIAGPNSVTMGLQGASQAVVYMGSIFGSVLGAISQGFQNVIGLISVASMAMEGDVEGARMAMGDLQRETDVAVGNLGNIFQIASDELDRFNELSEKSTGPQTMKKTGDNTKGAGDEMERLRKETEEALKAQEELNRATDEMMDVTADFSSQIGERFRSEYEKQERAIMRLGGEINNQIQSLDYELATLIDQANARELNADEQERLMALVDEIGLLEELAAENRMAEIIELAALRREVHDERKEQIQKEKEEALKAQEEETRAYLDKVAAISDSGEMVLETFGSLAETITNINQRKIDTMEANVERETAAIDQMVKDGVLSAELAAAQKMKIEEEFSSELQAMKMREFRMNQASALGDIAFGLAKAIAQAFVLPPGARGAQIALLSGLAAAQTAAVVSQPAPKFDVGGMVGQSDGGADVVNANLLRGEAVLDRATVNRIGGERGVQALQNGGGMGQTVIIQPFKHIDRYNRAKSKRMSSRVGSGGY
jgi:hypothetical protein